MLYILLAIIMFGLLIAVHELGHFATAKWSGVQVNEFAVGMGPVLWKKQKGETLYSLRAFPIGGYCAMEGEDEDSDNPRAFEKAATWKKIIILVAGAFMNFVAGLFLCFLLMVPAQQFIIPVIDSLVPEFPLQGENGLMAGDRIVSIDGERIYSYDDVSLFFSRSDGKTMDLIIEREGQKISLPDFALYPREYTIDGELQTRYGINFSVEKATLGNKIENGWYTATGFVRIVRISLGDLISGDAGVSDLTGPVGIVDTISQVGNNAASTGMALYQILYFAALIAVNLAVMNLLPLPALDGGRIFFILFNGIAMLLIHRKIPAKYEGYVHLAGIALLLLLTLFVTFGDIVRIIGR